MARWALTARFAGTVTQAYGLGYRVLGLQPKDGDSRAYRIPRVSPWAVEYRAFGPKVMC